MRKYIYTIYALCLFGSGVQAQVLWSDDFDSYTIGNLSNDPTGQTLGQGNWHVKIEEFEVQVLPEPGRGNVLAFGWMTANDTKNSASSISKNGFSTLWNSRTPGNDVLKLEYDFYSDSINNTFVHINTYLMGGGGPVVYSFNTSTSCDVCFESGAGGNTSHSIEYDFNWTKIEIYLDYDEGTNSTYAFIRIPSLGFLHVTNIPSYEFHQNVESLGIMFWKKGAIYSSVFAKFDNFKLSALPTRPSYLKIDDFVSSKFNVFPNPVTDMVTITNSENIGVEQIEVFDISGKTVKSLHFNNENEVQLHLGDFASGTYLLHIQTNEGTAVKKVVKK